MRPRLIGLLGGLATACAMALAACGGDETTVEMVTDEAGAPRVEKTMSCLDDEGYEADLRRVSPAVRREGATELLSVLLNLEGGTAIDNIVDIYFWDSKKNATAYVQRAGDGPLNDLHHEQFGAVTITYAHGHSHEEEHGHSHDDEDSHSHEAEHAEAEHAEESEAIDHEVEAIAACVA